MSPRLKAKKILDTVSMRCTHQRLAVLQVLLKADCPVTQEYISQELGDTAPNKTTIYRILESLIEAETVHKAFTRGRKWHYELLDKCHDNHCHPHFTCRGCGRTECLRDLKMKFPCEKFKGYIIQQEHIQLDGICPQCAALKG